MTNYMPREGVDYIVDLYSVATATPDMQPGEIKDKIDARLMQYHPDRLYGRAPEFIEEGERMTRLLNRARHILLGDGRQDYDQLLAEWTGPVSEKGVPTMRFEDYNRAQLGMLSPEEAATYFDKGDEMATAMFGYSKRVLRRLEKKLAQGKQLTEDEHAEYDEILAAQDNQLTVREKARMVAIGAARDTDPVAAIGWGHANEVRQALTAAQTAEAERRRTLNSGRFAARLAILSGEQPPEGVVSVQEAPVVSPGIATVQQQVVSIAQEREQLLQKRLDALYIEYPDAALQAVPRARALLGISVDDGEQTVWTGFDCAVERNHAEGFELPEDIHASLQRGNAADVIAAGYSVMRCNALDGVAFDTVITAVLRQHMAKLAAAIA